MNPTYERGPSGDVDEGLNTPTTTRHRFYCTIMWEMGYGIALRLHSSTPTGIFTIFVTILVEMG